jgi:hypothetical protein
MIWPALRREAGLRVASAVTHLLAAQAEDGFWRDYALPPGASESWTTAWVLCALLEIDPDPGADWARRAGHALLASGSASGWGYNRATGPDADSTAWTLRALAALGQPPADGWRCLQRYLDRHGRAHTFLESDAGEWGRAHADVTAMVGLALVETGAPRDLVVRVRHGLLDLCRPGDLWSAYWWSCDAYAAAWAIEFLRRSGGVPNELSARVSAWVERAGGGENALDAAHLLLAALSTGVTAAPVAAELADRLLDLATAPGWAPSPALLVPPKEPGPEQERAEGHPDEAALVTTSLAALALSRWLRSA